MGALDLDRWSDGEEPLLSETRLVLHAGSRSADAPAPELPEGGPDDVVELSWSDGTREWLCRTDFERWLDGRDLSQPLERPGAAATRDAFTVVLAALSFFGVTKALMGRLAQDLGAFRAIEERAQNRRERPAAELGLHRIDRDLKPHPVPGEVGDERWLLLVHGTFSCFEDGFGDFYGMSELFAAYGDRVLAFQHRTLTVSPIDNALELIGSLPPRIKVDAISHSRGGLVVEALLAAADPGREAEHIAPELKGEVRALSQAWIRSPVYVQRFVRVACPARGTSLNGWRTGVAVGGFLKAAELALPSLAHTVLTARTALVALVANRDDPDRLPGLAAMKPNSPLTRWLSTVPAHAARRLIVAGAARPGADVLDSLKEIGAAAFYGADNDLVVDTRGMFGGVPCATQQHVLRDIGPDVNHFNYFRNIQTGREIGAWLRDSRECAAQLEDPPGTWETDGWWAWGEHLPVPRGAQSAAVVLVPGLFGSPLEKAGWPELVDGGGIARLVFSGAVPGTPQSAVLRPLGQVLSAAYDVRVAALDWRAEAAEQATTLARQLEPLLQTGRDVHLVAHGTGCRVVAALDAAVQAKLGRIVFLGGGDDSAALEQLRSGPVHGLLGALRRPRDPQPDIVLDSWPILRSAPVGMPAEVLAIQAFGIPTLVAGSVQSGDGRAVPTDASGADAQRAWYVRGMCGDLPSDPEVQLAAAELLREGTTRRLKTHLPRGSVVAEDAPVPPGWRRVRGGLEVEEVLPPIDLPYAMAVCQLRTPRETRDRDTVVVTVAHGGLEHASHPVMVGHYEGDGIYGPEAVLDRRLDGALTLQHALGAYPGRLGGRPLVLFRPDRDPPGAVVVGLGALGALSRAGLIEALSTSMIEVALRSREEQPEVPRVGLSALLLGARGRGLGVADAVEALVTAVVRANQALRNAGPTTRIVDLELVEVYENVAVDARTILGDLAADRSRWESLGGAVVATAGLVRLPGGRRGRTDNVYHQGWWRRIRIARTGDELQYDILTEGSLGERLEPVEVPEDELLALGERLLDPRRDRRGDLAEVRTLFREAVPERIRAAMERGVDTVLLVDEDTAIIPWELFFTADPREAQPPSTRVGLVRQFVTSRASGTLPTTTSTKRALVIGNPPADARSLVHAGREALQVGSFLREQCGFEVTQLAERDATATAVRQALGEHAWTVVHIAAHGIHVDAHGRTGIMLREGDRPVVLTARRLDSLLVRPPDLVFLNCCHLGRGEDQAKGAVPTRFLTGLARRLIDRRCRAIVCAAWAVDDKIANRTAVRFYRELAAGRAFGAALLAARREAWREGSLRGDLTWGAYQAYGDPGFRLPDTSSAARRQRDFLSEGEVVDAAHNLSAASRSWNGKRRGLVERLTALNDAVPDELRTASVLEQLGRTAVAIGAWSQARRWLTEARSDGRGTEAGEQLLAGVFGHVAQQIGKRDERNRGDWRALWEDVRRSRSALRGGTAGSEIALARLRLLTAWDALRQERPDVASADVDRVRAHVSRAALDPHTHALETFEPHVWKAVLGDAPRRPITTMRRQGSFWHRAGPPLLEAMAWARGGDAEAVRVHADLERLVRSGLSYGEEADLLSLLELWRALDPTAQAGRADELVERTHRAARWEGT